MKKVKQPSPHIVQFSLMQFLIFKLVELLEQTHLLAYTLISHIMIFSRNQSARNTMDK